MVEKLSALLAAKDYSLYPGSVRSIDTDAVLFVASCGGRKLFGLAHGGRLSGFAPEKDLGVVDAESGKRTMLCELTWENYQQLARLLPISPSPCDKDSSFGTGDRLGMVSAAHLDAGSRYPLFPVIAQQSPRELERTDRTFKGVLLDAVMGALESGYTGAFGADADHIKDEGRFLEGVEAGFSMYTLDLSDDLRDINGMSGPDIQAASQYLSAHSGQIVRQFAGASLGGHEFSEQELIKSALVYEKSMDRVERFNDIAKSKLNAFDLEVSIDEGGRDTTPEDHLYVAEYLHRKGIDFSSLAPRFPGEFQKAVDYMGDRDALAESFNIHAELARQIDGYRLSLHSGSDKFSVYRLFAEATQGHFHIKTSGTSWLQAVKLVAHTDPQLFGGLYSICLESLPESKKAYHVYITTDRFPEKLPDDLSKFFANPDVQQLFHISYGALLAARRNDLIQRVQADEERHYQFVAEHIDKHLKLLFDH
ncbi:MAG: hypothetical protein HYX78_04080 [Armatimonadetes bacterium]|nr:hypothetical protein [Armatimonadota bacterium]